MEDIKRDAGVRTYRSALAQLRDALSDLPGPADLTPAHAERLAKEYTLGQYRRSKSNAGALRSRGSETVRTALRNLTIIWKRLKRLRLVADDVWADVGRPRVPKTLPRIPSEDAVSHFCAWLDRRLPGPDGKGWELVKTFIDVKSLAGCRLNDLCQVETRQFDPKAGTVVITPDQDKTYQGRHIALPAHLVEALDQLKGRRYLWERYVEDTAVFRPGRRRRTEFSPAVMYHAIQSIFAEYGRACPEHKVKSHDFRRRAITLTAMSLNGNWEAVAGAIPVTPETARKHYFDAKRVLDAAAVQKQMAEVLLPKRPQAEV